MHSLSAIIVCMNEQDRIRPCLESLRNIADEIIVMAQGAILARGTPAEISSSPAVQEAYLGAPEEVDL